MVNNLNISFNYEGLNHTIEIPTEDDNLPFNIAEAVREIIDYSNANSDIVIEELIDHYGYSEDNK